MDKQYVIAIRNVFEQIKIKTSDGVEHVPTMVLKLDNDAWIDDSKCELFWDDAKEVCFYYHYTGYDWSRSCICACCIVCI